MEARLECDPGRAGLTGAQRPLAHARGSLTRVAARGFTLLELVLAATLGALVVLACVGMFATIDRAERWSRARTNSVLDLSQTQWAVERAMQSLVTSDTEPPREVSLSGGGSRSRAEGVLASDEEVEEGADGLTEPEAARFVLAYDEGMPAAMPTGDGMARPQRLELALRRAPVYSEASARTGEAERDARRSGRRTRRGAAARREEADEETRSGGVRAPGVRGVFELTWETELERGRGVPGAERSAEDGEGGGGGGAWTLWWRTLTPTGDDRDGDEVEREDGFNTGRDETRVRLASGLRTCAWEVFREREYLDEMTATWTEDLPAYVNLKIETVTGVAAEWMFEVGWTEGPEPGSVVASALGEDEGETTTEDENGEGDESGGKEGAEGTDVMKGTDGGK